MGQAAGRDEASRTVVEAYQRCEAIVRAHYENFPVASRLIPRRLRPHVCALYAYARGADDLADEPRGEGDPIEALDDWERRLDRCLAGEAEDPVFIALGDTVRRFGIPDRLLRDLLDAFRQDCRVRRYERWGDLVDYCRRSANPVGRMVLLLFDRSDAEEALASDAVCTGLQLTNFWQDVAVDLRKDRIYLPAEDRRRFGVGEDDLREGRVSPGFRSLMEEMVRRTRDRFDAGRPLLSRLPGRLGVEIRAVWLGGQRVLSRIEEIGYDVFRRRPVLSAGDRLVVLGRALLGRRTPS